jgi:hypothetical protein
MQTDTMYIVSWSIICNFFFCCAVDETLIPHLYLQNVGDTGLAALGKGCPLLKEVMLSHCRRITDVGLSQLVKNCKTLESCHMVYCPCITSVGVATVCAGCNSLKKVLVEKWKVTDRTRRRHSTILTELCMDLWWRGHREANFNPHISIASYTISPGTFAVFKKSNAFLGWVLQSTVEEIANQM